MHAGIGQSHITDFMSVLEVNNMDTKTMKKREREVGDHVHSVANSSSKKALSDEIEVLKEHNRFVASLLMIQYQIPLSLVYINTKC